MVLALVIIVVLISVGLFCLAHAYYNLVQDLEGVRKAARDTAICVLNLQSRVHYLEGTTGNEDLPQLPQYRRVASS